MRYLPVIVTLGLAAACGEREYEEPKVETTVEYEQKSGNADATPPAGGGGGSSTTPQGGDVTDVNQLKLLFQATVNGVEKVFTLTTKQISDDAVLLMPNNYLPILTTAEDTYDLTFVFQVTPAHAFPRDLSQVTGYFDTDYTDAGSSEVKSHRGTLHQTKSFSWQTVQSGYGFASKMTVSGIGALKQQLIDSGRTVQLQSLTFVLTTPTNEDKGIIISIPVLVGG